MDIPIELDADNMRLPLTINNLNKIVGRYVDITLPLPGPGLGRGHTTRHEFREVQINWQMDSYLFILAWMPPSHPLNGMVDITIHRPPTSDGRYAVSLHKEKQSYSALLKPEFMLTADLFIEGLENVIWDHLPF